MKNKTMIISKEQIIKMSKPRSTDYLMPKCGFHESKKYDRKRAKNDTKREIRSYY